MKLFIRFVSVIVTLTLAPAMLLQATDLRLEMGGFVQGTSFSPLCPIVKIEDSHFRNVIILDVENRFQKATLSGQINIDDSACVSGHQSSSSMKVFLGDVDLQVNNVLGDVLSYNLSPDADVQVSQTVRTASGDVLEREFPLSHFDFSLFFDQETKESQGSFSFRVPEFVDGYTQVRDDFVYQMDVIADFLDHDSNRLLGDLTDDGKIGFYDFIILARQYGKSGDDLSADIDRNGAVDMADFLIIARNFGRVL